MKKEDTDNIFFLICAVSKALKKEEKSARRNNTKPVKSLDVLERVKGKYLMADIVVELKSFLRV